MKQDQLIEAAQSLEDVTFDIWRETATAFSKPVEKMRGPMWKTMDGPRVLLASYVISLPLTTPFTVAAWALRRIAGKRNYDA